MFVFVCVVSVPKEQLMQTEEYDLNVVRLCIQVFLQDETGHYTRRLNPIVTNPIYDNRECAELELHQTHQKSCKLVRSYQKQRWVAMKLVLGKCKTMYMSGLTLKQYIMLIHTLHPMSKFTTHKHWDWEEAAHKVCQNLCACVQSIFSQHGFTYRKRKFFIHTSSQTTPLPWSTSSSPTTHVTLLAVNHQRFYLKAEVQISAASIKSTRKIN